MLKLLIGPALLGAGYVAGSYYGSDVEQVVHQKPSVTYAGVEQALGNVPSTGKTFFEGGTPVPYEIKVDHTPDQRLVISLLFNGQPGAVADVTFTPQNGGKDTLVATRIHADRSVLRTVLAGSDRARLAYAPDWMLNLALKPELKQLADLIDQGQDATIQELTPADEEAQWESNLSDQQRQQVAEWRQYDATRPSVDPNAAAKNGGDAGDGQ